MKTPRPEKYKLYNDDAIYAYLRKIVTGSANIHSIYDRVFQSFLEISLSECPNLSSDMQHLNDESLIVWLQEN